MILECKQRLHVVNATFDMVLNAADDLEAYTEQMLTEVYDHDADGLVSSSELGDLDGGSFVTLDESLCHNFQGLAKLVCMHRCHRIVESLLRFE